MCELDVNKLCVLPELVFIAQYCVSRIVGSGHHWLVLASVGPMVGLHHHPFICSTVGGCLSHLRLSTHRDAQEWVLGPQSVHMLGFLKSLHIVVQSG